VITLATGEWAAQENNSTATVHTILQNTPTSYTGGERVLLLGEQRGNYHCFAILEDATPGAAVDFGFDTSVTATNLLSESGYTYYRRLGTLRTDNDANWYSFIQRGDTFWLQVPEKDYSTNTPGLDEVTATLVSVPKDVQMSAMLSVMVDEQQITFSNFLPADFTTVVEAETTSYSVRTEGSSQHHLGHLDVLTNTSSQIKFHISGFDPDFVEINVRGWRDFRERDQ